MSTIFRWLSGNRDHHIIVKQGGSRFWWYIVRMQGEVLHDVANCPAPGFLSYDEAVENARAFLDGVGASYLDVASGKHYLPSEDD